MEKRCVKCGSIVAENATFCSICGASEFMALSPQNRPMQAQPMQNRPMQAQPMQNRPMQAQPTQGQPMQAQSMQNRPVQAQPVQNRPMQAQPMQNRPMQAQPMQNRPMQAQPTQGQPMQAQPMQNRPMQAPPVQNQPVQNQPMQNQPMPGSFQRESDSHTLPPTPPAYLSQSTSVGESVQPAKKKMKWWQIALIVLGGVVILCVLLGMLGGGNDSPASVASSGGVSIGDTPAGPVSGAQLTKTVMIYVVGSDLESQGASASFDISEMMDSGVNTDNNTILVYTGGAKKWWIENISSEKNAVYRLVNGEFELVKEFGAANMGKSDTLKAFIEYGMTNYAADEYGLILWDHGGGPMLGYGNDEIYNDKMEMSELKAALSSAGLGADKKLEFLGFDACLMGTVETAWEVKDYAKYFIASQEAEPGCGWDYSFLKQLDAYDSGKDIGVAIVDSYILGCEKVAQEQPQMAADVTLSCMDLSKIGDVEKCLNALFSKVDKNVLGGKYAETSRCRNNAKAFGKYASTYEYDLIDLGHISTLLSADYATESKNLTDALQAFVCYSKSNVTNATGVSIYHPYDNVEEAEKWVKQFQSLGFASDYAHYISDFGSMMKKGGSKAFTSFRSTKGKATNSSAGKELSIQLTPDQAAQYAGSTYYILKKVAKDEYLFIFAGKDGELGADGVLSASYNNKAVYAVNDKTNEISDTPITMYQIHDGSDELKYFASAMFWLTDGDDITKWKTDPVEWQIKIDNGQPKALGAFLIEGPNGPETPQKKLLNYKEYTQIEFSFSTRTPKRDAAGNLLPYFDWESTGKFYGNQYNVADGFHLECREVDNKDDYYVMFVVRDVNGKEYASELFSMPK